MLAEVVTFSLWAHAEQEPSPDIIDTNHTTPHHTIPPPPHINSFFVSCYYLHSGFVLKLKLSYFEMFSWPSSIEKLTYHEENVPVDKIILKTKNLRKYYKL